ncbi:hypothetical protein [Butyrivibrio sp. VCB2006]|uniref:hypothetical protein n=1 Tax=Butyrivibrio sp. VCB2006 TaxID=1280679 RepID=UPI00040AFC08|nr:hypothetical protein [Butyrivibrio sp. VCB2006]
MKTILNIILIIVDVSLLALIIISPGKFSSEYASVNETENASEIIQESATSKNYAKENPQQESLPAQEAHITEDNNEEETVESDNYTEEKSASQLQKELFEGGYEEADDSNMDDILGDSGIGITGVNGRATIDDFDWFLDLVEKNGMPDEAQYISNPDVILGDWKCMVIYDPANTEGKREIHFAKVHIDSTEQADTFIMNPIIEWDYIMDDMGKEIDESGRDTYTGIGEWTEGWIGNNSADHNVKIRFYTTGDGKQYAYGGITLQEVKSTGICLVRP